MKEKTNVYESPTAKQPIAQWWLTGACMDHTAEFISSVPSQCHKETACMVVQSWASNIAPISSHYQGATTSKFRAPVLATCPRPCTSTPSTPWQGPSARLGLAQRQRGRGALHTMYQCKSSGLLSYRGPVRKIGHRSIIHCLYMSLCQSRLCAFRNVGAIGVDNGIFLLLLCVFDWILIIWLNLALT